MRVLFTFENLLPSAEADAEVFVTTARYLAPLAERSWLHVPVAANVGGDGIEALVGMPVVPARAPRRPAALRHFLCGLTLPFRPQFRAADLVYTRNLWVAWVAVLFGQRVAFDHYRPWPDQIPPLRFWLYRLISNRRFLINICHSSYTLRKYQDLGIADEKLRCVRNGFEPRRLDAAIPAEAAKREIGVPAGRKTVVYTGRINHKKGLHLVIEAARLLPDILFVLVGSYGRGPIEEMAEGLDNVRIVPWQSAAAAARYVFAAEVLLIPPSLRPLTEFGTTVLPLKLYFYLASGRPILAGDTPDVGEVLKHGRNAYLCRPDSAEALAEGIRALTGDAPLAARLAAAAQAESSDFTWQARARKISDLIEDRLRAAPAGEGAWGPAQGRAWRRQSWRWLIHLVRTRSWVLPAAAPPPASGPAVP